MQTNNDHYITNWQRRYSILAVAWSMLVVGSLAWDIYQEKQSTLRTATAAAIASINKDMSFRKWATFHGGVYVPPTEQTPPNPYLKVPDRDVVTTTGKALTLMNPAYMLREIQSNFPDDYGTQSHITSLKPINPKNTPDAWEIKALSGFEQGAKELLEIQQIDGEPYLRLMRPFFVEQGCLKCHEQQGYKLGEIRGGISTAIFMEPYLARERKLSVNMMLSHGAIWLIGLASLGVSYRRDRRQAFEREAAANNLRASEHGLNEAQRIAHLGSWNLDIVNNVLTWSDEIYRIFEIDPEKFGATYESFLNAIHPDDREQVNNAYTESLKNRVPYNIEHRLLMKDGRVKYVNEICETFYGKDDRPVRSFGIVHDITERKQLEEKVNELNRNLESRVIERTALLEASNKDMEDFSYSISHDLRAPLRAINGFSKILQEEYADRLDDEGKRLLNVVGDNARKMGELIDGLLAFSRAGRSEIMRSPIDMKKLVSSVWEELKPKMAGRNVHLDIRDMPPAEGDPAMIRQVVLNLLSNAVKFTEQRADAQVEIGWQTGEHETVYHVKDNGVGFDMQYADKLFGVFLRLHGMDEFEGAGIGLAIVKRIVTKHGGRVWAEGRPNEGATIYFALPIKGENHE
ncbi:MAG: ATP-binding protein [Gallionella sp.]